MKMKHRRRKKSETENKAEIPRDMSIPSDLMVEILTRLPVKSLGRCICASKSLAKIIRSKEFVRSFTIRSSLSHPSHPLLVFKKAEYLSMRHDWYFFFDVTSHTKFQIMQKRCNEDVNMCHVHGLISFLYGQRRHIIINPCTGKYVTLPNVTTWRQVVKRFFGYDPVCDEYKMLCIVETNYGSGLQIAPNDDQVLTLGSPSSQWRRMKCNSIPHTPICNGICIDGVISYFAYVKEDVLNLVQFGVKSEELSFFTTSLLKNLPQPSFDLICYERNVAIANRTSGVTFDLWVLKNAVKDEWSKVCLTIGVWNNMVSYHPFRIAGTTHMGEIVLTHYDVYGCLNITYHDHKTKNQRKVEIPGKDKFYSNRFGNPGCFLDYKESTMFM